MSLVHEALEKAKREASARTAKELGLPDATGGSGQPYRARRRHHPAAIAGATALFTLAVVAAAIWLFRAPNATPSATPNGKPASAAATAVPISTPPSESATPAASAPTASAETAPASVPPATSVAAPAVVSAPERAAPPVVAAPADVAPAAAPARAPSAPAQTPSFRRETTLADGTVVRLGGIAWSEEAPLAYLNGKLYVKGERVAGLRVERIERDRVLLVGDGTQLYLTLR